jgi:capsular polysaccharide biosynthesis protein
MLRSCLDQDGRSVVVDGDPGVRVYDDVLFVPYGYGSPAGLYDRGRALISSGAHFATWPHEKPAIERHFAEDEPSLAPEAPDDVIYFYGHHITHHFGHFLFSILARLWALPYGRSTRFRILLLHLPSRATMDGFAGQILGALNLTEEDLITFDRPVRLRSVVVPSPAFRENNIAYSAYHGLCQAIGRILVPTSTVVSNDRPVFLSKARLRSGLNAFSNEDDLIDVVERHGVDIIFPETLSMEQQIRLFKERQYVLGVVGSAFHTCVFGNPVSMIGLSQRESITSNQVLLDRLCGNRSLYVHSDRIQRAGQSGKFENIYRIDDPQDVADDLLRLLDKVRAAGATGSVEGFMWSTDLLPTPQHALQGDAHLVVHYRASDAPHTSLGEGWSFPESGSIWSDGPRSTVSLPAPAALTSYKVAVDAHAFTRPEQPTRTLWISTPERHLATETVSQQFQANLVVHKDDLDAQGRINLIFEYDSCPSPAEAHGGPDRRHLGIALQRISVRGG